MGNTAFYQNAVPDHAVHPHACGEHISPRAIFSCASGSSPRLWGTPQIRLLLPVYARFIPTPVGNTQVTPRDIQVTPVHPHACGEHLNHGNGIHLADGSSPRLWGTRKSSIIPLRQDRFIPTPVGNTLHHRRQGKQAPVHPHACGEHFSSRISRRAMAGSSPRLWGTLLFDLLRGLHDRFIPTPVGNTGPRSCKVIDLSVHPHACGEH